MTIHDTPEYSKLLEAVKEVCGPKALAFLGKIRMLLIADGLIVPGDAIDTSTDDYQWSLIVYRHPRLHAGNNDDHTVDITLEISEERNYDDPEGYGINFGVDITEYEGRVLGGLAPYNYTPQCWVDARDPLAVAARWRIIEDSDIEAIPGLITDGWERTEDGWYKDE